MADSRNTQDGGRRFVRDSRTATVRFHYDDVDDDGSNDDGNATATVCCDGEEGSRAGHEQSDLIKKQSFINFLNRSNEFIRDMMRKTANSSLNTQ